jgi:hypothetical protein
MPYTPYRKAKPKKAEGLGLIVLTIIGIIWAIVFTAISVVGFLKGSKLPDEVLMIHMGSYAWMVSKSLWYMVLAIPGYLMLVAGIVAGILVREIRKTASNKSEEK